MNSQSDNSTQTDEQFLDELIDTYEDRMVHANVQDKTGEINHEEYRKLYATIQEETKAAILAHFSDRLTVEQALACLPEYSGDWSAYIGDKHNDERHRQKWFRIGWNTCRAEATTALKQQGGKHE